MRNLSVVFPGCLSGFGAVRVIFLAGSSLLLASCSDIDFSDKGGDDLLMTPENVGRASFNDTLQVYQVQCGQSAVYRIVKMASNMGVLTLHTYRDMRAPKEDHCNFEVKIVKRTGENVVGTPDTVRRSLVPGESMTEAMDVDGVNNLVVILKCVGSTRPCYFDEPQFTSGVRVGGKAALPMVQVHSNPLSARVYTDVAANPCTTQETVLHKVYVDPKLKKVKVRVVPFTMCKCETFFVTALLAGKSETTTATEKKNPGNDIEIKGFDRTRTDLTITGRCGGNKNGNQPCKGDALVYIDAE